MNGFTNTIRAELKRRGVDKVSRDEVEQAMLAGTMLAELGGQILFNRLGDAGEDPVADRGANG